MKSTSLLVSIFTSLPLLALSPSAAATDVHLQPIGQDALTAIEQLPLLRSGVWLTGTASQDVHGGNDDGFGSTYSYLYKQDAEYVFFDVDGPGCIYELRTIGFKGNLRVYLDGADAPQFTIPFADIYSGENPPFVRPLIGEEAADHGSCWSYVPIPFANGCKLTSDENDRPGFFNVFAHKFAAGTTVQPFNPQDTPNEAAAMWRAAGVEPAWSAPIRTVRGTAEIASNSRLSLLDVSGAGAVMSLKLRFPRGAWQDAPKLWLRAWWDGAQTPQVDTPLSTFFALGCPRAIEALEHSPETMGPMPLGKDAPRSLPVGLDEDGWLYSYFPMPYGQSGHVALINESSDEAVPIECAVALATDAYPAGAGRFHALWRETRGLLPAEDYTVVSTRGRGHYLGCVLTMSSVYLDHPGYPGGRGHLEGDSRFYIDDAREPHIAGTGTEEYFNWGWYSVMPHDQPFTYPTHGYTVHAMDGQDHSVMFRFHISDIVPFYRAFAFELEHGPEGRTPAHYSGTAFFYQRPAPGLVLTDELDIGDAASEKAHAYKAKGSVKAVRDVLPYEGAHQMPLAPDMPRDRKDAYHDDGREWTRGCSFTAKIAAKNNGAKLRRRSSYLTGIDLAQEREPGEAVLIETRAAKVLVDGQDAGLWRAPGAHARAAWRETEFEIPRAFTEGKQEIEVALEAADDTRWDEYTYWVYSYTE